MARYSIGTVLREVGSSPARDWTVVRVDRTDSVYDLTCDGSSLCNWPDYLVEDENLYKWVAGSGKDVFIVGATYRHEKGIVLQYIRDLQMSGLHEWMVVENTMELDYVVGTTYAFSNRRDEFELVEDTTTSSATTPSAPPRTEGEALMQFFATPQGQWRGWSNVRDS